MEGSSGCQVAGTSDPSSLLLQTASDSGRGFQRVVGTSIGEGRPTTSGSSADYDSATSSSRHRRQRSCSATLPGTLFDSFPNSGALQATKPLDQAPIPHSAPASRPEVPSPFTLPSLASITASLSEPCPAPHPLAPPAHPRHLSPLVSASISPELSADFEHDDDSQLSAFVASLPERRRSSLGISIAAGNRPRSHSLLSTRSFSSSGPGDVDSELESGDEERDRSRPHGMAGDEPPKKRSRTLTTPTQQRRLMQILEQTRFPSTELREQLARELGMTPRRVQIWFQNRRQGMKKAMEQRAEAEASAAAVMQIQQPRGYPFTTYTTSVAFGPQGVSTPHQPSPLGYNQRMVSTSMPGVFGSGGSELFNRPFAGRGGAPVGRPVPHHLHLGGLPTSSNSSLSTLPESPASFNWSGSSSTWAGSAGFPGSANSMDPTSQSTTGIEGAFAFKPPAQPFDAYEMYGSLSPPNPPFAGRARSQTNPEPFAPLAGDSLALPASAPDLPHTTAAGQATADALQPHHERGFAVESSAPSVAFGRPRSATDAVWVNELARMRLEGDRSVDPSTASLGAYAHGLPHPSLPHVAGATHPSSTAGYHLGVFGEGGGDPQDTAASLLSLTTQADFSFAPPPGVPVSQAGAFQPQHARRRSRSFNGPLGA